jgi:hypothetical protein
MLLSDAPMPKCDIFVVGWVSIRGCSPLALRLCYTSELASPRLPEAGRLPAAVKLRLVAILRVMGSQFGRKAGGAQWRSH